MYILEVLVGLQAIMTTIFLFFLNKNYKKMETLTSDINRLKNDKIKGMETKIDLHIKEDSTTQKFLTELSSDLKHFNSNVNKVNGQMVLLSDKISNTRETTAKQDAKIDATNLFVNNINTELQRHKHQPKH